MLSHRLPVLASLFLALATSVAAAQTATAPTPPATAPAAATAGPVVSFSTPLDAAKAYVRASFGQDAAAMREALLVPPARASGVDARLAVLEATRKLQAAAIEQFKSAGAAAFASAGPSLDEQLKTLDAAKLEEKGDTATLTLPQPGGESATELPKTIVLKKADGQWKIDATSFFDLDAPPEKVAARTELARKVTVAAQEVTKDLQDKKFRSAVDAYQEFWVRCQPATTTTTATAVAPATKAAPESRP
jgi:hypothetical protein